MKKNKKANCQLMQSVKKPLSLILLTMVSSFSMFFASTSSNAIWDVDEGASTEIATIICDFILHWGWIVFLISLGGWLLLHNDKVAGVCKKTTIGVCALYIVSLTKPLWIGTLTALANFFQ